MAVVVVLATVVFGLIYFKRVSTAFVREGTLVGCLWLAINVIIDLPLMLAGPVDMTLSDYFADIGLTYVIIPLVMIGLGRSAELARAPGSEKPAGDR